MKRLFYLPAICSILLISCFSSQNAQTTSSTYTPVESSVTYQDFYNELSPYGRWVNYAGYGNVWVPMEQGFSPYSTNGNWVYTNMGWAWQSGYQWGWAPFHYGRWFHDNNVGWAWTPGYEWAPAWVNWRGGSQYYGWSPMAPAGYQSFHDDDDWFFVERRYITQHNLNNYYINNYNDRRSIIQNSNPINNYNTVGQRRFNYGPSQQEVEAATNSRLHAERVEQMRHAVMNNRDDQQRIFRDYQKRIDSRQFPENRNSDHSISNPTNEKRNPLNPFQDRSVSPPKRAQDDNPNLIPNRNITPESTENRNIQSERRFNRDQEFPPKSKTIERPVQERPPIQRPLQERPIDHQINTPVQINSQPIREFRPNKVENPQPPSKKPDHQIQ